MSIFIESSVEYSSLTFEQLLLLLNFGFERSNGSVVYGNQLSLILVCIENGELSNTGKINGV